MLNISSHQGNVNQNYSEKYHLTPVRKPIIKKNTKNRCWKGCKEKGKLYAVLENVNWYNQCGKWYEVFSKKLKLELPYDPVIPLLGIYPENPEHSNLKYTCIPVFIAALFTVAKICVQPRCPSKDALMK